jgi:signal transduction histidine kinase
MMRLHYWQSEDKKEREDGISITEAKKLLKQRGGRAWTEHYERDGTMFEVTPIRLKGNNSRFSYNHHL